MKTLLFDYTFGKCTVAMPNGSFCDRKVYREKTSGKRYALVKHTWYEVQNESGKFYGSYTVVEDGEKIHETEADVFVKYGLN